MQPYPESMPPEVPHKQTPVHTPPMEHSSMGGPPVHYSPAMRHSPSEMHRAPDMHRAPTTLSFERPHTPLQERPSQHDLRRNDHRDISDLHQNWRAPSAPSIRSNEQGHSMRESVYEHNGSYHGNGGGYGAPTMDDSMRSRTMIDDDMHHLSLSERYSVDAPHRQPDGPASGKQWASRQQTDSVLSNGKQGLVEAVQHRRPRTLEQMLDNGTRADPRTEAGMLCTAAQNRDVDCMLLLLRYGANANGMDSQGWTPLYAVTDHSFFEGVSTITYLIFIAFADLTPQSRLRCCSKQVQIPTCRRDRILYLL